MIWVCLPLCYSMYSLYFWVKYFWGWMYLLCVILITCRISWWRKVRWLHSEGKKPCVCTKCVKMLKSLSMMSCRRPCTPLCLRLLITSQCPTCQIEQVQVHLGVGLGHAHLHKNQLRPPPDRLLRGPVLPLQHHNLLCQGELYNTIVGVHVTMVIYVLFPHADVLQLFRTDRHLQDLNINILLCSYIIWVV